MQLVVAHEAHALQPEPGLAGRRFGRTHQRMPP
jgi:hypothetical protein